MITLTERIFKSCIGKQGISWISYVLHPGTPPKAALHLLHGFVPDRGASTKGEHAPSILQLLCSGRQRWAQVMDLEIACLRASSSPFWWFAGFHCIAFLVGKAVVIHRSCRPTLWLLKLPCLELWIIYWRVNGSPLSLENSLFPSLSIFSLYYTVWFGFSCIWNSN